MTILIVDDDIDDLLFFTDALAEIDPAIRPMTSFNGIDALQKLETADPRPNYIFLDLNMPKMDGRQCLKHLKKNPIFNTIPVIIYSTTRRQEDMEELLELGAAAFMVKPNKFLTLKSEIQNVLEKGRFAARL